MDALISGLLHGAAAVAERYGPLLATAALKGSILLGAAALATRAMRRASAASRHLVWSATVAGVLALPLIEAVAPRLNLPIVPASVRRLLPTLPPVFATPAVPAEEVVVVRPAEAAPALAALPPLPPLPPMPAAPPVPATPALAPVEITVPAVASAPDVALPVVAEIPAGPVAVSSGRAPSPLGWAMLVWAAGAAVVLLRLALGTLGLARLVRRARPADDASWVMLAQRLARELGIRRPVTLLVGRTGTVPVTWGVVYPIVLLPADADEWGEERRRAVLLHELAHVERFDALTHVLSQLALAVFWFNPLVSLAARRLRAERERACDDVVLAVGTRPTDYAGDLLELVQTLGEASPAAAALAMARRSEFEGRLLAILDPAVPRSRTSRRATLGATVCAALAVVPLAAMRPAPEEPAPPVALADAAPGPVPVGMAPAENGVAVAAVAAAAAADVAARPDSLAQGPAPDARFDSLARSLGALRAGLDSAGLPSLTNAVAARGESLAAVARRIGGVAANVRAPRAAPTADGCGPLRGRYFVDADAPAKTYRVVDDDRCLEVHASGAVEFTEDYGGVKSVVPNARLVVTETREGVTRRMTFAGDSARTFLVGGAERPAAEGTAWLRRALGGTLRDAGFDVEWRVDRLRREGGVAAVLDAVRRQTSDGVKRRYLERLLASAPALTDAELRDVALAASRTMVSDGDKTAVLRAAVRRGGASPVVGMAVVSGVGSMTSDGEKRRVLEQAAQPPQATLAVLTLAAQSAKGIVSDGDKAAVLMMLAPRVGESGALRAAFFGSVDGIISSGERRNVLSRVLEHPADDSTVAAVLVSARGVLGETDRAAVLRDAAPRRALATPWVREAYLKTAGGMVSEASREAVLTALVRAHPGDLAAARGVLAVASRMVGEHAKANVLLEVATKTPVLKDEEGRAALFAALKSLTSGTEYRRVMEAVIK